MKKNEIKAPHTGADLFDSCFKMNIGIYTSEMQKALMKSTVAIAGLGGVGGRVAENLARNGIGTIIIAGGESFEMCDINRQNGAYISTLGSKKADVIEKQIKDINPACNVIKFAEGLNRQNLKDFLKDADVIIDAVEYDSPSEKLDLYQWARQIGSYVLTASATGLGTLLMCFDPDGVTVEEIFDYPGNSGEIARHKISLERLSGCKLNYLPPQYYMAAVSKVPYISTNSSTCMLCGSTLAVEAVKIIFKKDMQYNAQNYEHLDDIDIVTIPLCRRIDLFDYRKDGIIDIRSGEYIKNETNVKTKHLSNSNK